MPWTHTVNHLMSLISVKAMQEQSKLKRSSYLRNPNSRNHNKTKDWLFPLKREENDATGELWAAVFYILTPASLTLTGTWERFAQFVSAATLKRRNQTIFTEGKGSGKVQCSFFFCVTFEGPVHMVHLKHCRSFICHWRTNTINAVFMWKEFPSTVARFPGHFCGDICPQSNIWTTWKLLNLVSFQSSDNKTSQLTSGKELDRKRSWANEYFTVGTSDKININAG